MTEHEKDEAERKDKLEVPWVVVLGLIFALFAWGWSNLSNRYTDLDRTKLDKGVFEEHQRNITAMQGDISRIRDILEKHAVHFGPGR